MKAAFYTLGCKVNQYETQIMTQRLRNAGYEIVEADMPADVYIVNSCTVTAESDRKTRQTLRRLKRRSPAALVVLTGCFPQSDPERAAALPEADVVVGVRERGEIDRVVGQALRSGGRVVDVSPFLQNERFEPMTAAAFEGHTRAFVKIEDGCRNYCSYCVIPRARGPVRSKPPEELAQELRGLARAGYREIVLVGINLSAYGSDLGLSLADALETAEKTDGLDRIRLGSLEEGIVTDDFLDRITHCKKLCPHFHLSLQSGCAQTLRRMNRRYTPEEYALCVETLRAAFPGCGVTTDVIVGFPGETEEEFESSLSFVKAVGFSQAHVFAYSRRRGTRAAELPGQVTRAEKERRSREMIACCAESRGNYLRGLVGKRLPVLFERCQGGVCEGFAPNYIQVRVRSPGSLHGRIADVTVTGFDDGGATGKLCHKPEEE